jgi:integrase
MTNPDVLVSSGQLSDIFNISECTIKSLVKGNKIPHTYSHNSAHQRTLKFNLQVISDWLKSEPAFMVSNDNTLIKSFKDQFQTQFPEAMRALQDIDRKYVSGRQSKGFNLVKVSNKKHGFLYYVRYRHEGGMLPSKWNTHTNVLAEAEFFARENRKRLITEYLENHQYSDKLYDILGGYYRKGSSYLAVDEKRNRALSEKTRSVYFHFVKKVFIPFLKTNNVTCFTDITAPVITRFQNHLLCKGNKPQTINRYLGSIKVIFSHLLMTGIIKENIFKHMEMLRMKAENYSARGCYEIEQVKGVFNNPWEDKLSYLLCLMIYSTGMRNSEIERMQVKDIIEIETCYFIHVKKSKTRNGIRLVPLHEFVYGQLRKYIEGAGKSSGDEYIFSKDGKHNQSTLYRKANKDMGCRMGKSERELEEQGISFYSGRHYWKTLMNAGNLGTDIEEYFMGHKVSKDVAYLYNHRDRQGKKKLAMKGRRVFSILEKMLFNSFK